MSMHDMVILGDERAADLGGVDDEAVTVRIPEPSPSLPEYREFGGEA